MHCWFADVATMDEKIQHRLREKHQRSRHGGDAIVRIGEDAEDHSDIVASSGVICQ